VIDCAGSTLTAVFAVRARQRGEQVRVVLDPSGCIAYPADDASADDESAMDPLPGPVIQGNE
jgi:hypothetical protein